MNKDKLLRAYEISIYLADEAVGKQSAELRDILRELVVGEMTGGLTITAPNPYVGTPLDRSGHVYVKDPNVVDTTTTWPPRSPVNGAPIVTC